MKRDGLTPEEKALWDKITQHDKPLPKKQKEPPPTPKSEARQMSVSTPVYEGSHVLFASDVSFDDAPVCGLYAGIDRKTAERFRKGKMPFDAVLDLHGQGREKARHNVQQFLQRHYEKGARCVLVITGKGKQEGLSESKGVLRDAFPGWLSEPGIRPLVLAFDVAQQKDGGAGAFYILLRRQR